MLSVSDVNLHLDRENLRFFWRSKLGLKPIVVYSVASQDQQGGPEMLQPNRSMVIPELNMTGSRCGAGSD